LELNDLLVSLLSVNGAAHGTLIYPTTILCYFPPPLRRASGRSNKCVTLLAYDIQADRKWQTIVAI